MIIERLTADHILSVQLQPAQQFVVGLMTPEYAHEVVNQKGVGWAGIMDGRVIACAGIVEAWADRGMAWALFSDEALARFSGIHRTVRNVIAEAPWRRIEMTVDATHDAGCRWAERLGFQCEGLMRAYARDGRDCFLYAKVK